MAGGELLRRLGRNAEAFEEFSKALEMTTVEGERRLLLKRIAEVSTK